MENNNGSAECTLWQGTYTGTMHEKIPEHKNHGQIQTGGGIKVDESGTFRNGN
jgi:hypothetical protein